MTDTIVVRLREDPRAGNEWRLSSADPATLEMIGQRHEPAHADCAGASVWTFKPKKTGRTRLALTRLYAANEGDPAAGLFAVDLDIR